MAVAVVVLQQPRQLLLADDDLACVVRRCLHDGDSVSDFANVPTMGKGLCVSFNIADL